MLQTQGDGQLGEQHTLGLFALVSYIPDPLARFLDDLRMQLTPGYAPRAHVTILPPRPVHEDLKTAIAQITEESRNFPPFHVELGSIEIFGGSNVVYAEIERGAARLREFHDRLNHGPLDFNENFPYHPHITLAQNVSAEESTRLVQIAREKWAAWRGPRGFAVGTLSFVQHVAPSIWTDVAEIPVGLEVVA